MNWCFWTVVLEKTLESPLDCKEVQPVHPKGVQSWVFFGRTDAKAETPIHLMQRVDSLKRLWCWEGLGAGGEGDDRGWDGWMASRTRWTWIWVNSGRWWWTGRPGVLRFMGSQRVVDDWATELNWTELTVNISTIFQWRKSLVLTLDFTALHLNDEGYLLDASHLSHHIPSLCDNCLYTCNESGGASQVAQWSRVRLQCRRCKFRPWVEKIP